MEQSNKNVITYEKVKNELKNINLAEYKGKLICDKCTEQISKNSSTN